MIILTTPEDKKVKINQEKDALLYDAPANPPNTGTTYTDGTDLYAHRARSGAVYFYTKSWSMWQGVETTYELLSEEEARQFIIDRAGGTDYIRGGVDAENAEKYLPGIFMEDA
jgi:hypothetical protein